MKKLLIKLLIAILAVTTIASGLIGCSSASSWGGTSMTNWGAGNIVGGFIGEKDNYYYYINGVGVSTEDNSFGAPVKGALMAVDKNDMSKTEIVVPKLFVASDYKAGLYIFGDYVYYGTPNTDKNSEGNIANSELTFMKTKLDGTGTEVFFTLKSLAAEYRMVEKDGVVYIVYYDSENVALKVFDTSAKTTQTIAVTDDEIEGVNAESLNAYKFAENGMDVTVYYTVTVYAEEYYDNKDDSRATQSYNKVYAYKVGDKVDEQTAILNGSDSDATYDIKMIKAGKLYYGKTVNSVTTNYAYVDGKNDVKIINTDALAEANLFVDDDVYSVTDGTIVKTVLTEGYNAKTENVAIDTGASTLIAKNGDYIYFVDSESGISRIDITKGQDANVEKVSESTVYSAWYSVKFIGNNLFYCDNSSEGASYIKYIDITTTVTAEDTDDDGENDKFYLEGHKELGKKTEKDIISIATAKVNKITNSLNSGELAFEKNDDGSYKEDDNGKIYVQAIIDAENAVKDVNISDSTKELLAKYKKAVEMANLYYQLEGIRSDLADETDLEAKYNAVKANIEAFRDSDDYDTISAYINDNLLWNYEKAMDKFEAE